MGTTLRTRYNFLGGLVENNPLASTGTTLTSASLAQMPAITGLSYAPITLDPDGIDGAPEVAWITDHAANATTATLLRGQEGTTARAHFQDTSWVHSPTVVDTGMTETDAWLSRFKTMVSGGGVKRWDGNNASWTTRFIYIYSGRTPAGERQGQSQDGYVDINMPASGTVITGNGGVANQTVTAAGIPLPTWTALYYVLDPAMGQTTEASRFQLVGYTSNFVVPKNWVFICGINSDDGRLRWCTGETQDYWRGLDYANGHTSYDYGGVARFTKTDNTVHVQGLITKAANTSHFHAMPVGYRPRVNLIWSAQTAAGLMETRLETNGLFFFNNANAAAWASVMVTYEVGN